jgi:hypothetical protein
LALAKATNITDDRRCAWQRSVEDIAAELNDDQPRFWDQSVTFTIGDDTREAREVKAPSSDEAFRDEVKDAEPVLRGERLRWAHGEGAPADPRKRRPRAIEVKSEVGLAILPMLRSNSPTTRVKVSPAEMIAVSDAWLRMLRRFCCDKTAP